LPTSAGLALQLTRSRCKAHTEAALAIWRALRGVEGTPVATYLLSRGLDLPASLALRFHAGLKNPLGRRLACDAGAGEARRHGIVDRRSPHLNIQHTVRYTELAPDRFKDFWRI